MEKDVGASFEMRKWQREDCKKVYYALTKSALSPTLSKEQLSSAMGGKDLTMFDKVPRALKPYSHGNSS
jgi:hypothetical protein